ncbi:hypothetical protein BBJ29_003619 [Phytophthora kernoviae]|uniref:B30.2/SPRY domain-containing protein n=1 Tax=Phytophthora kernoviae TaxID=325452 RepID=A0A3F2RME8_9STRA|nr:hypothetical protein BBP00_00006212 [Phytophthora kernoviae]RLN62965.1 hypothetical protein BBJ29_003619 [Phytophthora kernoviae]
MAARSCQPSSSKRTRVLRHLFFTSGRHYWEVLVERMADPRDVVVGVTLSEAFERSGAAAQVVGYAATGVIRRSGVDVCRAQAYAVGDTVGVYLDMNTQQVAFFLNDEAQLDQRADNLETRDHNTEERGYSCNGGDDGHEMGMEMKPPVHAVETKLRGVTWYSFRSRAMFAALETSADTDRLIVIGAELPDGYG